MKTTDILKSSQEIGARVVKGWAKEKTSYTCCNIEVNEPAGSEVMCPSCKEYCETKGAE